MEWLIGPAAILAAIWVMVEMGHHFDTKEDDPKFRAAREKFGLWLTSQNEQSFPARVRQANELFFQWFDALFYGKGTLLEQGLWLGLVFSPVMLLLTRLLLLVVGEQVRDSSHVLLFAMILAFVLSIAAIAARPIASVAIQLGGALRVALGGALFGVLYGGLYGVLGGAVISYVAVPLVAPLNAVYRAVAGVLGGAIGVFDSLLAVVLVGLLVGVLFGVLHGARLGALYGVFFGTLYSVLYGVLYGDLPYSLNVGTTFTLGVVLGSLALGFWNVRFSVHPLRSVALSLMSVCLLGAVMREATTSFYHLLLQDGPIVLGYVAFNLFGDAISLLETRWVLQSSLKLRLRFLPGLVLLDLVLSAVIFLFLPLVLGELPSFWENILFRGSRPWLGIFFWSTFATSLLFYLFVGTVVFLIAPGHGLARLFHQTVGRFYTIESRPFSAIALGMSLLIVAMAVIGLAGPFLYRLVAG